MINQKKIKVLKKKSESKSPDLCDFSDPYTVVGGTITLEGDNNANKRNKNLAFKSNAPFILLTAFQKLMA